MKEKITIYTENIVEAIADMEKQLDNKSYIEAFPEIKLWLEGRISGYKTILEIYAKED